MGSVAGYNLRKVYISPPERIYSATCLSLEKYMAKSKKHYHKFVIERAIGVGNKLVKAKIDGQIGALDLYCDCGMSLFVEHPTWHKGDMDEQFLTIKEL